MIINSVRKTVEPVNKNDGWLPLFGLHCFLQSRTLSVIIYFPASKRTMVECHPQSISSNYRKTSFRFARNKIWHFGVIKRAFLLVFVCDGKNHEVKTRQSVKWIRNDEIDCISGLFNWFGWRPNILAFENDIVIFIWMTKNKANFCAAANGILPTIIAINSSTQTKCLCKRTNGWRTHIRWTTTAENQSETNRLCAKRLH